MYALNYPRFVHDLLHPRPTRLPTGRIDFRNNNRMLRTYDGIVGGKTGYDDDAGWCLINVAQRDGNRMIAVTMNGVAPTIGTTTTASCSTTRFEQKALRAAERRRHHR